MDRGLTVSLERLTGDTVADVVIVGLGGAGTCAAIEAARAGADVLVLERAEQAGGATALSAADLYFGGNGGTPIQQAAGFEDSTEDFYRYLMLSSGSQADEDKVRLYAEHSRAHFDWMVENGLEFKSSYVAERTMNLLTDDCLIWSGSEAAYPFAQEAKPCPRGHFPRVVGPGGGRVLMDVLGGALARTRARISLCTRALELVVEPDGRVSGVIVERNGKTETVGARRAVILCAGGFAMNAAMVREHAPRFTNWVTPIGTEGDDGSGIMLGSAVGAATVNLDEGYVSLPFYPPASLVSGILVNEQGQRFINEDCYHGRVGAALLAESGTRRFLIVDDPCFGLPAEVSRIQVVTTARTVTELEQNLGLPAGSLEATVGAYNRHAASGDDPALHKHKQYLRPLETPPFRALDCSLDRVFLPFFTLGGLQTRPTGEVVDTETRVIPGLYAAGRTAAGIPRRGSTYSSGLSVADATFSGRLAGRAAAGLPAWVT